MVRSKYDYSKIFTFLNTYFEWMILICRPDICRPDLYHQMLAALIHHPKTFAADICNPKTFAVLTFTS